MTRPADGSMLGAADGVRVWTLHNGPMRRRRPLTVAAATLVLAGCARSAAVPAYTPSDPPTPIPAAGECVPDPGPLQDSRCTPGALNHSVDGDAPDYAKTICNGGWPQSQQPPADYTDAIKRIELGDRSVKSPTTDPVKVYGKYAGGSPSDYTLDALVPAGLGGDEGAAANLWAMPTAAAQRKHALQEEARNWVCAAPIMERPIRLMDAQRAIMFDWRQLEPLIKRQTRA